MSVPEKTFLREPHRLVPMLRSIPREEVRRRQRALAEARPQLIFEAANSTAAGANFLTLAAERCLPRMVKCGLAHTQKRLEPRADSARATAGAGAGAGPTPPKVQR